MPLTLRIGIAVRTGMVEPGRNYAGNASAGAECFAWQVTGPVKLVFAGLYMGDGRAINEIMSLGELVVITLGVVLLVAAGIRFAMRFFSEDAKWERRRRRSNFPISTRSDRPMVKLSVKTRKQRRK